MRKNIYFCAPIFRSKSTPLNIMYAIVDIAGQQFKVEKDKKLYVHRLEGSEGDVLTFDNVMLLEDEAGINVGKPFIDGASVSAKILSHVKGDKVIVFKKKRRKGYQKANGHRQQFSQVLIEEIATGKSEN
jgi:large subunit ribosomal protein L21